MKLTSIDEEFLWLLDEAPQTLMVVGDLSRTWREDKAFMVDIFSLTQKLSPETLVGHHGAYGFDHALRDAAACAGASVVGVPAEGPRFGRRSAVLGQGLLVFVSRVEDGPLFDRCWSADPTTFEEAQILGLPVFAATVAGEVKAIE